jgi:hypothetical protein
VRQEIHIYSSGAANTNVHFLNKTNDIGTYNHIHLESYESQKLNFFLKFFDDQSEYEGTDPSITYFIL